MNRSTSLFTTCVLGSALAMSISCNGSFGSLPPQATIVISRTAGNPGTSTSAKAIQYSTPDQFTFHIEAHKPDGTIDDSYNGFVRLSAQPGNVVSVSGPGTTGRNAQLSNGVADGVVVNLLDAFGEVHIWAEDLGYVPVDPARTPPPQCSDGIDNNNNGKIDFPNDPGCAYANDDTEDGASYTAGVSDPLFYTLPRVADVRGVVNNAGAATSFPFEQVLVDTGYRTDTPCDNGKTAPPCFEFSTYVSGIGATGFYVADPSDPRGYSNVFAYNFSTPPQMRICDRLFSFGGTTSDFFGYTEVNYPTWTLEEWGDESTRECGIPAPYVFQVKAGQIDIPATPSTTPLLLDHEAGLVRVQAGPGIDVHISKHFGPANMEIIPGPMAGACKTTADCTSGQNCDVTNTMTCGAYTPTADATNCDLNKDGKVDFSDVEEGACGDACTADAECTEYSGFLSQNQFRLVVVNSAALAEGGIFADGSADPNFDPVQLKGQSIGAFTGNMTYFSGGHIFTVVARCPDDIVTDPKGTPFLSDSDYDAMPNPPPPFIQMDGVNVANPARKLACVLPRTAVDYDSSN